MTQKLLRRAFKVTPVSITQVTPLEEPDPDPSLLRHSSKYNRTSLLKKSNHFFAKSFTNVSPRHVVASLELAHALSAYSELHPGTLDALDRGEYDNGLLESLLAAMSSATMMSFIRRGPLQSAHPAVDLHRTFIANL